MSHSFFFIFKFLFFLSDVFLKVVYSEFHSEFGRKTIFLKTEKLKLKICNCLFFFLKIILMLYVFSWSLHSLQFTRWIANSFLDLFEMTCTSCSDRKAYSCLPKWRPLDTASSGGSVLSFALKKKRTLRYDLRQIFVLYKITFAGLIWIF